MNGWIITAGGYGVAAILLVMLFNANEKIGEVREACNTEKLAAVAEAEKMTREATEAAMARRLAELVRQAERAEQAQAAAEEARRIAEARPPEVREVIRRVADANACIDTAMPDELIDSLRID